MCNQSRSHGIGLNFQCVQHGPGKKLPEMQCNQKHSEEMGLNTNGQPASESTNPLSNRFSGVRFIKDGVFGNRVFVTCQNKGFVDETGANDGVALHTHTKLMNLLIRPQNNKKMTKMAGVSQAIACADGETVSTSSNICQVDSSQTCIT